MGRKKLLSEIPDALTSRLPEDLRCFETNLLGRLLKIYYGDPAFHFEVWFHESKGLVGGAYQGGGFRYYVLDRAEGLSLVGYVRNMPDGRTVEVVAEGPRDTLETLLRALP